MVSTSPPFSSAPPVTEAELHAHLDGQLPPERDREVREWLALRPAESQRLAAYRQQQDTLRQWLGGVLTEPVPAALQAAAHARDPSRPRRPMLAAAAVLIALLGGLAGWHLHGWEGTGQPPAPQRLAERAVVAHAVYAPDRRRAVEVDSAHEEQLVTWLSRRLGTPVRAPHLQALGFALEGGRLLPGERAPVAQFMYVDAQGQRLTLYVSNEPRHRGDTGFQFARHGDVNVFYWVDGAFGYALVAPTGRDRLAALAAEVHRQLTP